MHGFRLLIEIHQGVFKSHEKVKLFEDAAGHHQKHCIFAAVYSGYFGFCLRPVRAVEVQIREFDVFPPADDVGTDFIFGRHVGHSAGHVIGENNLCAEGIFAGAAAFSISIHKLVDGIFHEQVGGAELIAEPVRFSVGFQGLSPDFHFGQHCSKSPFLIIRRTPFSWRCLFPSQ